jgi:hypothetical protein
LYHHSKYQPGDRVFFPTETELLTGVTFSQPVAILGSDYNGLVIENCTFLNTAGTALTLREVNNVTIRNNTFQDILGNGITLDGSLPMEGIQILDNTLEDIWGNGISVKDPHSGVLIQNNNILRAGIDLNGSAEGKPHHGIYIMGSNFVISGNRIDTVINPNGNGISARSNGIIRGNIISRVTKSSINYYSDHPASGTLLIENNIAFGAQGFGVGINSNGQVANHIEDSLIRFNTLITEEKAPIKVGAGTSDIPVSIYGNLMVREDSGSLFLYDPGGNANIVVNAFNLMTDADPGFVDKIAEDFHIRAGFTAATFDVSGAVGFPQRDVDGELRDDPEISGDNARYVGADDLD